MLQQKLYNEQYNTEPKTKYRTAKALVQRQVRDIEEERLWEKVEAQLQVANNDPLMFLHCF